jgi:N-acetyl-anhydromuramyl-L-alanine amidase AmpD/V8-like Glu-specific endopeptidase
MAVIRANRESIDDRFSVLGFTVRSELPLFEIAIATDPALLRPELRAQRTPGNFHTSRLLRTAPSQRGEAVYLVPPEVVSRFVGQQRLYFGLATYRESDRSTPVSMRMPDRGTMYVSLSGLTERGLRRSVRSRGPLTHNGAAYGGGGVELGWGGDAAGTPPPPSRDEDRAAAPKASTAPGTGPTTYSDGYSDELWTQPAPAAAPAPTPPTAPDPATAPSATAQGLARRNGALRRPMVSARSLLISSDYQPANFWDALRAQAGFFLDSAMWYLGVLDTRVMPHSAVCQIRVPDGSAEGGLHGSGFFIGPRLIMTAAHVVNGQSELIVVRGKNGGGTAGANEPFGRFKVKTFRPHGSYGTHGSDFDIALIQVPAANAVGAGQYFDLVEELTQSRPEGVVVSGYAARWYANDLIEHFVNETIDPNRQHLMGGHIRELPTDETFSYNIQTLGGTSGSPVYWIEDTGAGPQAHLVGVHVAAHDATTNLGCRITANKLTWIRQVAAEWGQTLTFSMGRFARGLSAVDEDSAHDIGGPIPDDPASTAQGWHGTRGLNLTAPEYPMASRFEAAASGNFRAVSGTRSIDRIVIHITDGGASINGTISWFKNPAAKVSAHYVIGQDGEIVQMVAHKDVAWHAGSANGTSIGIEHVANTKGLNPTPAQMCASAALVTWLCDQFGITPDRAHILGHAEADGKTTHQACPNAVWDWVYYMDMITTRTCYVPDALVPRTQSLGVRGHGHSHGLGEPQEASHDGLTDPDAMGIDGDIPDGDSDAVSQAQAWYARALGDPAPEYPGALKFAPAHPNNYTPGRKAGTAIDRIVIHITASKNDYDKTVKNWFQNPKQMMGTKRVRVSAHYVIGRGGEVVQVVAHGDTAHHANGANSRSIGIEHNATTTRDHAPTDAQYRASARLVAWLCAQLGLPADRSHVLGHSEVDPRTTHTSCPNSVWDWDTYMGHLAAEAAALSGGVVAQGLGLRRGYAMAQEIITPFYDPADPASALTCQADAFSQAREEWFAGVPNTTLFPHSAICLLEMNDGSGGVARGTGFYIGRNRILTCAHNLHNQASVVIIPGKNGNGGASTEPFGRVTVTSASWRIPASYGGSNPATDLAVIDNVPIDAPNGLWFDELEELNQSRPEGVVVCGYSSRSTKVPELTKAIDGFKQHLHAGYIAALAPDDSTFSYPILTLKRASGSPVYYLSDKSGSLRSYVVGVHTGSDSDDLNRGCRLMQNKIDWIEGRTTSLSLGASGAKGSRSLGADGPSDHAVHLIPQPNKHACWAAAMAMLLAHRRPSSHTPESIAREVGGSLATSFGWDLIKAVKARYGFEVIDQPSNASIYHAPKQWAEWLNAFGPLWVVIVGAPHAVVVAGIRGNLDDPASTEVKILNPWDTRTAFDNDPVEFRPANVGYEAWLPFDTFAGDFGNMAEADYGNWRILHLPASAAGAQALSAPDETGSEAVDDPEQIHLLPPPPPVVRELSVSRALDGGATVAIATTIAGAVMERLANNDGDITWELDQLRGYKHPNDIAPSPLPPASDARPIRLTDWPAVDVGFLVKDRISAGFEINWQYNGRSVGNVLISNIATNDAVGMGLVVKAKIMDDNIVYPRSNPTFAALRVRFEYRFTHYVRGDKIAIRDIRLFGDGTYSDDGRWEQT